jgi:hypothetical protein
MKTQSFTSGTAVGLVDWLKQGSPEFSLVVGATCRCDISQLGRDICGQLNRAGLPAGGRCRAFGPGEIRQLAGDPMARHAILAAAARKGIDLESGCDHECMVRAIAALGGAVMSGEWAFEATEDMDNVFRVALAHCGLCCPEAALKLDPEDYSAQGLARIIAKRFLHWMDDRAKGRKPVSPRGSALAAVLL